MGIVIIIAIPNYWAPALFLGIIGAGLIVCGLYVLYLSFFYAKLTIDFKRNEIWFYKASFGETRIHYQSIVSITAKQEDRDTFLQIYFELISGKTVKHSGYINWFSGKSSEQRTEEIILILNDAIKEWNESE